ncbi:FAD-dependent oxidoreductase [Tenacibaculum aestuariivivum]|uniref:FAD-dependent oxidoreductase n=1 Tax=Tenacibaculum aestuariivivum TaxID=2006131 RepID=UPI003AB84E73
MIKVKNEKTSWTICKECKGRGKKRRRIQKKAQLNYKIALNEFEKSKEKTTPPTRPKGQLYSCLKCTGSGLISSNFPPVANTKNFPHVAIIGAGIGGVALAVACLHRGIPYTLYERDSSFNARSQGYGLTLQQASKAIEGFGILHLKESVISTKHIVHTTNGEIIGEWGMRKWRQPNDKKNAKHTNIHIARQALRLEMLAQLGGHKAVQWNHKFINFKEYNKDVLLNFKVNGVLKSAKADLVVGADGIRSTVKKLFFNKKNTPLRYLNCIVILGICPLKDIPKTDSLLLDAATVFQTANGNERIYMMPYSSNTIMWQLSFPMLEEDAKILSKKGAKALKEEACRRTQWHIPIPQILEATKEAQISGYPVYDSAPLTPQFFETNTKTTLIGDAAHPMSPFKGQGANQALLDALALAREITSGCRPLSEWRTTGIRKTVLTTFELEMLKRSTKKVKDSAKAAVLLHSKIVLNKGNEPRGRDLNSKRLL